MQHKKNRKSSSLSLNIGRLRFVWIYHPIQSPNKNNHILYFTMDHVLKTNHVKILHLWPLWLKLSDLHYQSIWRLQVPPSGCDLRKSACTYVKNQDNNVLRCLKICMFSNLMMWCTSWMMVALKLSCKWSPTWNLSIRFPRNGAKNLALLVAWYQPSIFHFEGVQHQNLHQCPCPRIWFSLVTTFVGPKQEHHFDIFDHNNFLWNSWQKAGTLTTSHHRQVPKASRVVDVSIVVAAVAFSKTWQIYCSLDIVLEHLGFCVSGEEKNLTSICTMSPCVM